MKKPDQDKKFENSDDLKNSTQDIHKTVNSGQKF